MGVSDLCTTTLPAAVLMAGILQDHLSTARGTAGCWQHWLQRVLQKYVADLQSALHPLPDPHRLQHDVQMASNGRGAQRGF